MKTRNGWLAMTKTVSSNEAKQKWGAMISAASNGDDVIVEVHGKPRTVMISFEDYQQVQELREKQRRAELLKRFDALQRRLEGKNRDLSEEQVEEIAIRAGREINAAVAERRRASVERGSS